MKRRVPVIVAVVVAMFVAACSQQEARTTTEQSHADTTLGEAAVAQEHGTVTRTSNASIRQVGDIPKLIACGADVRTSCLVDTTRAQDECCTGDVVADWILVTDRSDSLEFFVGPGSDLRRPDASITMQQLGRGRAFQEHDVNTASYLRFRFPEAGAYTLHVGVPPEDTDSTEYELRVRQTTRDSSALRGSPLVFLDADSSARLAILPDRKAIKVAGGTSAFEVTPGWYRLLAPGLDSVFVCRIPCTVLQPLALAVRERHVRF